MFSLNKHFCVDFPNDETPLRNRFKQLATDPAATITPDIWEQLVQCNDGDEWRKLIATHPEAAAHCPWQSFDVCEWWPFFKYLPQYFEKCHCPDEVPPRAWAYLLCQRPELADRFNRWSELTEKECASLLKFQPTLAEYCSCLEKAQELTPEAFDDDYLTFPAGDETTDFLADTDYFLYYCSYGDVLMEQLQTELGKEALTADAE